MLYKRDTSGVFPFTSLASNILVVIGGIIIFHDHITVLQEFAVLLAVVFFIIYNYSDKLHFTRDIVPSLILIALLSTFNKFVQKIAASQVEPYNFIFWEMFFMFVTSFFIWLYNRREKMSLSLPSMELTLWAAIMGLVSFGSTYFIVKALTTGPISLVYMILGSYTFLTSIFAAVLFKEKITKKSLVAVLVSFVIVLLIKLG